MLFAIMRNIIYSLIKDVSEKGENQSEKPLYPAFHVGWTA